MKKHILFILLIASSCSVLAQEMLTLSDAIDVTLRNNYDIRIAQLDTVVSNNNATAGNAGLLPNIYAEGSYNYASNNTELELLQINPDGSQGIAPLSIDGAVTETLTGAVNLEYTIFDGFGGFHRLNRLKSLDGLTQLQTENLVENVILNTITLYLNAATQQANVGINEAQLTISKERLKRTESDFKFGATNRTSVLRAQVDVKNDSVALRQTQLNYKAARTQLNSFMGREPETVFQVIEEVVFFPLIAREELVATLKENNTVLQLSRQGLSAAEYDLKALKAEQAPKVFLNGGYSYLDQQNDAGQVLSLTQDGWNVGVGLRLNIFDGSRIRRNIQNAKVALEQRELEIAKTELDILTQFTNIYDEYQQAQRDMDIEKSNLETFQQSFDRSQIDYSNGQISSTDLRTAQLDLSNAQFRIVRATYTLKQKEAELLTITGTLLNRNN